MQIFLLGGMLGQAPMFPVRDAGQGNVLRLTFFAGFSFPSFFGSSSCKNKSNYLFLYRSQVTCFNEKKKMARNLGTELFTSHFHFHFFIMVLTISKYCMRNMWQKIIRPEIFYRRKLSGNKDRVGSYFDIFLVLKRFSKICSCC